MQSWYYCLSSPQGESEEQGLEWKQSSPDSLPCMLACFSMLLLWTSMLLISLLHPRQGEEGGTTFNRRTFLMHFHNCPLLLGTKRVKQGTRQSIRSLHSLPCLGATALPLVLLTTQHMQTAPEHCQHHLKSRMTPTLPWKPTAPLSNCLYGKGKKHRKIQ